jgi:tetratricopeptide (TPR) repeat protein
MIVRPRAGLVLALLMLAAPVGSATADDWTRLDQQAAALYRAGDYARALSSAQEALALAERDFASAPGDARLATSLNALALIHQAQGRYDEAQSLLERALAISTRVLPADHPNLGALRANLESLREARRQQELTRDARRAQDLNEQAMAHHKRGEYERAAVLYAQALPIVERHFGVNSVEAARVLANWADTCEQRKDHSRAEELYRRALDIYDARDDEAVAHAGVLNSLASVHYMQRRYDKAEPLFKRSLELLITALGEDDVDLLPLLDNLTALYLTTRRGERAEEIERRARSIRKAHGLEEPQWHAKNIPTH